MVIKRENKEEDVIKMANGGKLYMLSSTDSLENMKELADDALKAFEASPTLTNRLDMLYYDAEYRFVKGEREKAAEDLKAAVDSIEEMTNNPECMLKWMDLLSLLTEFLLTVNRPEEALVYANEAMEVAENHFYDTLEYAYACELYGTALTANGEIDNAEDFYRAARSRIKNELADAERLLACIDKNLECIDEYRAKNKE